MATAKTIEVPCWHRRFVDEEEMRSLLDLKRPAWMEFKDNNPRVRPNRYGKYDRDYVEPLFARQKRDKDADGNDKKYGKY